MKIVFFSNFLNHHQTAFCEALESIAGKGNFTFLADERTDDFRIEMGYSEINSSTGYVLCVYDSNENFIKAKKLIADCDLLIATGGCPPKYLQTYDKRAKSGKTSFVYSERPYKKNIDRFNIRGFLTRRKKHTKYENCNSYLLCAGAYTAKDFRFFGAYKNKCFKFGYFPDVESNRENLTVSKDSSKSVKLLWAGRLIDWKCTETALNLADYLKKNGVDFCLDIVGTGNREPFLRSLAYKLDIEDKVNFLGALSHDEVRKKMKQSDIFLFTSNRQEGWGAVLNESMGDGCAVVANCEAGATEYLVKDGYNGIVYSKKHHEKMYEKVLVLCSNRDEIKRLGENAARTMKELWNAKVAAQRLVKVYEQIKEGKEPFVYSEGPLSNAE